MAIDKLKHVSIVGFQRIKPQLLVSLQEAGFFHLESLKEEITFESSENLKEIESILKALEGYEKGGIFKGFAPPIYIKKEDFKKKHFKDIDKLLKDIIQDLRRKEELLKEKKSLQEKLNALSFFSFWPLSYKEMASIQHFSFIIFKITSPKFVDKLKGEFLLRKIEENIFFVLVRKKERESFLKTLEELNFKVLKLPEEILKEYPLLSPPKLTLFLKERLSRVEKSIKDVEEKIKKYLQYKKELAIFCDYKLNESFKEKIISSLKGTDNFFFLEGWIPKIKEKEFLMVLNEFNEELAVQIRDPLPSEEPPTKLVNRKSISPFEIIVDMYGAPHPYSVDPTPFLAPFFFFFVGLCISDAGYGIILSLLSFYLYKKKAKTQQSKRFFRLLSYLGVSTAIVGIFLGSFFGFNLPFKILDIMKSPFSFLLFCFFLGFVQVIIGLGIKVYLEFKFHKIQKAIATLSWIGVIIGLPCYFIFKFAFLKILTIIFLLGVLFFSSESRNLLKRIGMGLYELYGITKYLSDILSYSRLLALGMATGVIAMVVNILTQQAIRIPFIGYLFGLLVFVGGHLFNLFINLLSGFIHSARLQFVEFFSKFFMMGKRFFSPLEIKTKYVRLID